MKPSLWLLSVGLSMQEERIIKRIRKARLFVFLRHHRHELMDKAFQEELMSLYRQTEQENDLPNRARLIFAQARCKLLALLRRWQQKTRLRAVNVVLHWNEGQGRVMWHLTIGISPGIGLAL